MTYETVAFDLDVNILLEMICLLAISRRNLMKIIGIAVVQLKSSCVCINILTERVHGTTFF